VGVVGGAVAEGFDEGVVVGRADLLEELDVEEVGVVGGVGDVVGEGRDRVEVVGHEVDVGYGGDGLVGGLRRGERGGGEKGGEQDMGAAESHGLMDGAGTCVVAVRRRAGWSLRLRLRSGLRQSGRGSAGKGSTDRRVTMTRPVLRIYRAADPFLR